MNLQSWHRIGEIYHSALHLPRAERSKYVATACGENEVLQREVTSLLEADDSSGDFLTTTAFELGLKVFMDDDSKSFEAKSTVPTNDNFVGTTVDGRYRIERKLDHGGVGVVYLARDQKLLDKPVVVKILLEKSLQNEWFLVKFQQEKEALARVDHPGVVGILDTGELPDGRPYIVMQYVEGVALRVAIKEKPEGMDFERIASIIKQAGAALSSVHERKIHHRDLKPENIMLQDLGRGDEQVKIVDFGIAKVKESVVASSTVTGTASAGTIVYMSPEQLRGERVSALTDIYSLGLIAYEMVTGRRPFNPETSAHLADMQRDGVRVRPVDLRPRLSLEAQSIILKALEFEPQARYQTAREFGIALANALTNDEDLLSKDGNDRMEILPTELSVGSIPMETQPSGQFSQTIVSPIEPAVAISENQSVSQLVAPQVSNRWWLKLVIGLVLFSVLAIVAYVLFANKGALPASSPKPGPSAPLAERSLIYSLTVQKMRDDKPYQEPFESSGQEIFENGYAFRLNVSSPQSGYLYVFNEGVNEKSEKTFTIIYPTPATNKGSAKLDANQPVKTSWNRFAGQAGTEEFWMVWSASPVTEMETARDAAFKGPNGTLTDAAMARSVKEFLAKHSDQKPETSKDTAKQQTDVRGKGDLLVKLVELEHR